MVVGIHKEEVHGQESVMRELRLEADEIPSRGEER